MQLCLQKYTKIFTLNCHTWTVPTMKHILVKSLLHFIINRNNMQIPYYKFTALVITIPILRIFIHIKITICQYNFLNILYGKTMMYLWNINRKMTNTRSSNFPWHLKFEYNRRSGSLKNIDLKKNNNKK